MAKCAHCGKSTSFGHNRSFSMRATNRTFKPNLTESFDDRKWQKNSEDFMYQVHPHHGENLEVISYYPIKITAFCRDF